jgi:hypothetical protein
VKEETPFGVDDHGEDAQLLKAVVISPLGPLRGPEGCTGRLTLRWASSALASLVELAGEAFFPSAPFKGFTCS